MNDIISTLSQSNPPTKIMRPIVIKLKQGWTGTILPLKQKENPGLLKIWHAQDVSTRASVTDFKLLSIKSELGKSKLSYSGAMPLK